MLVARKTLMRYSSDMSETDGRKKRGAVRHAAYREAAKIVKLARLEVPPEADTKPLVDLYFEERRRLGEWLGKRGRGVLCSPPGGVGNAGGDVKR